TRRKRDGLYVLAAEQVVRAVTRNPPNYRNGVHRIWGDLHRSRYFHADFGPNAEPLIRARDIRARAGRLGRWVRGGAAVREISEADHQLCSRCAADRAVYRHAAIYAEDAFEARLVHGAAGGRLGVREWRAGTERRLGYLYETVDMQRARRN